MKPVDFSWLNWTGFVRWLRMLDEACRKWITCEQSRRISSQINGGQLRYFTWLLSWKTSSVMEFSHPPSCRAWPAYIYFPSLNLRLSVHPFRFCGQRSKRTHALRFGKRASSSLFILERAAWALDSGTDAGKSKKKKTAVAILSQGELFSQCIPLPETVLILERIKKDVHHMWLLCRRCPFWTVRIWRPWLTTPASRWVLYRILLHASLPPCFHCLAPHESS